MNSPDQRSGPITLVISEIVEPSRLQEYETWTKNINQAAREFEGFLGVDIVRPRDHAYPEYVVIVKFDTYVNFRNWMTSPTYRSWMSQARGLIAARSQQNLPSGLELWFTLPETNAPKPPTPAFYKQVVLGILGVYPLILLANAVLGPVLKDLPPLLGLLISVTAVSILLTYPVMPWLTKILSFWLYPSVAKSRQNQRSSL